MTRREFILAGLGLLGAAAAGGVYSYVHRPKFGELPSGERLRRMQASPHYHGDHFENLVPVPVMSEDEGEHENRFVATWKFLFGDKKGLVPAHPLPTEKANLLALPREQDAVVWLGHSSFFVQLGGCRILIDPVFSSYASPLWFINRAFAGSNVYTAEDFPEIDVLAMSHDHWDHLDYPTVMALKSRVHHVVCPLGVGAYFEQWGFAKDSIHEEDWDTEIKLSATLSVHILPSQHFSGRFLKQNPTLWCGMAFITPKRSLYYTGDGGYGAHFRPLARSSAALTACSLKTASTTSHGITSTCCPRKRRRPVKMSGQNLSSPRITANSRWPAIRGRSRWQGCRRRARINLISS